MWIFKRLLFKMLGLKKYLGTIRTIFFISYKNGWLKNKPEYYCHYNTKKLIKEGDTIIDIGANLGYYTRIFATQCGNKGKVYAVEPVSLFRNILQNTIKRFPNVTVVPYALGRNEGKKIKMGLPSNNKYLSHGRTKVLEENNNNPQQYEFEAEMRTPKSLFKNLEKLNYIKCDIEGYESVVIPELLSIIEKFLPTIQIETEGENREAILNLLTPLGYEVYYSNKTKLIKYKHNDPPVFSGDLIFMHEKKTDKTNDVL